jgi:hypothetical protein
MAAQAWKVYNLAKKKIGNTTINLAATTYRMALHTSASNAATLTLGVYGASITNEVATGNGYTAGGKTLTSERWTVGASVKAYMFDVGDIIWTGTGGTIPNIKFADIYVSAAATANKHLLCVASLTSNQFTLASGNTLTLQINSLGVFQMV